ncbi:WD40-repeat-containing domain protein [Boletus edulis BED1]|uniref:WD40-repeat-containing domain protein n=1 Tax=Boletus edulis BED1 TaxID=1328754 RepID=A0AAD4GA69_BOLED|nr:WD40-repeat-containing domain protein [Boletus edulis BED1]
MNNTKTIEIDGRALIRSLAFLEDGNYLLSGSDKKMIRQWRVCDGVEVGEGMKTNSKVTAMDLSGDGKWIVSSGERVANVWSTRSRRVVVTVNEHSDWVDTVHVSPDSTKFATGCNDKRAFIWDIFTGERLVGPLKHEDRVGAVRFSPDGDLIATGTAGGMLRIYDAHNGELLRTIPVSVPSYPSKLITWSSTRSIFALVSQNTLMHIDVNIGQTSSSWTVPGEPVKPSNGSSLVLGSIASSSNGRFIVSFVGQCISLWDTSTSARISSDIRHSTHVWSIALSSDDKYLAISDANKKITLRNISDIISNYYLVGQRVVQQPQIRSEEDLQPQIEALRGKLRALELRIDELGGTTSQPSNALTIVQAAPPPAGGSARAEISEVAGRVEQQQPRPLGIRDGSYRIKSNTTGLYLTCPQDTLGTVVVQELDELNVSQRWTISFAADGAYNIAGHKGDSDVPLSVGSANTLVCVPGGGHTTWTIEPRGDAYVIGNAEGATAIHLQKRHRRVSVSVRNNSQNQRWMLDSLYHTTKMPKEAKPKSKSKGEPKQALSAYMFFSQDRRERIKAENPDAGFGEVGKLLGAKWKELDEEEKKPYINMAAEDMARAEKEKASLASGKPASEESGAEDKDDD